MSAVPPHSGTPFFIIGPTSAGKTALSVKVAKTCNAEIVSADAFQIYAGLDVLTAAPTPAERDRVPHHLFGVVPAETGFDVGQYHELAVPVLAEIAQRNHLPLVVGGNGLYIRALTDGLSPLPATDPRIRSELERLPLEELATRYRALDPVGAEHIDLQNPRRLVRAIEVCMLTGKPFSILRRDWSANDSAEAHVNAIPARGVALVRDREGLYERINQRVESMFADGAVEEVAAMKNPGHTASQVIGYREISAMLRGELTQDEAVGKVQQITRKYAKRQLTWIRRQTSFPKLDLSTSTEAEAVARVLELIAV